MEVVKDIIKIQMKIDLQERIFSNPFDKDAVMELNDVRKELKSAIAEGSKELVSELKKRIDEKEQVILENYQAIVDSQIRELDERSSRKMATINKWKQQKKNQ